MSVPPESIDAGQPRRLLFETIAGQRYEQADDGLVYRDGEMLWTRPPIACCSAQSERERPITVGSEAVFMFVVEIPEGVVTYIHTTPPLRKVIGRPRCGASSSPRHWLRLARRKLGLTEALGRWVA